MREYKKYNLKKARQIGNSIAIETYLKQILLFFANFNSLIWIISL